MSKISIYFRFNHINLQPLINLKQQFMKKIILSLGFAAVSLGMNAQSSPEAIKTKIDELAKQKAGIEAQITDLTGQLPAPVIPTWSYKGNAGLNFGQSLLGNDWSSAYGGNSNLNLQGVAHVEANMKKSRHSWDNSFDGKFGFIKNFDDNNTGVNTNVAKNADLLQLASKYLYDLQTNNLKIGMGATFISQFTKTYDLAKNDFLISDFLAPGTLDLAPGLEWKPKPYLSFFFAPAMGRLTFVTNDSIISRTTENKFGNDKDQKVRSEVGAKLEIEFKKELVKNLVVRSKAQLFNNWSRAQTQLDAINSSRTNIDVNWQTDLFYKLTKNIAVQFGFQTRFDDDVRIKNSAQPGGFNPAQFQFTQNFGLGFVAGF
jgi:hypothetical protein